MPQQQPIDPAPLRYEIEMLLQQIALAPADLSLHQSLRKAALRYKAAGGPDAGTFEKMKRMSDDPLERLVEIERLWSLDSGNLMRVQELLAALQAVQRNTLAEDFAPTRQWLYSILSAGDAET